MKKFKVYNTPGAIKEAIRDLTCQMVATNCFYSLSIRPHKDPEYVWVCMG